MITVKGKFSEAQIYTDFVGEDTINQLYEILNQEFTKGSKIRIMPDCHIGKGCVIGTTMTITDKVVPSLVGVDIGCGMHVVKLGKVDIDFKMIDDFIHEYDDSGAQFGIKELEKHVKISDLKCGSHIKKQSYILKTFGTIGGGNHFIEIDKDDDGEYYLIIHSGSRNLGSQVAVYYQDLAILSQENKIFNKVEERKKTILTYKRDGRQKEIEKRLKEIDKMVIPLPIPKELCYLEGEGLKDYLFDMNICQQFAALNRKTIATAICAKLGLKHSKLESFETIHNYIDMKDKILRKGAISAYEDETVLIPINMKDGCIIGKGKSCEHYNYSAPHGAGRLMSRGKAKNTISLEDYQKAMEGIYTTSVNEFTIDESPFAYKPLEAIIDNIKDTVEIIKIIKPVYNYKRAK